MLLIFLQNTLEHYWRSEVWYNNMELAKEHEFSETQKPWLILYIDHFYFLSFYADSSYTLDFFNFSNFSSRSRLSFSLFFSNLYWLIKANYAYLNLFDNYSNSSFKTNLLEGNNSFSWLSSFFWIMEGNGRESLIHLLLR